MPRWRLERGRTSPNMRKDIQIKAGREGGWLWILQLLIVAQARNGKQGDDDDMLLMLLYSSTTGPKVSPRPESTRSECIDAPSSKKKSEIPSAEMMGKPE